MMLSFKWLTPGVERIIPWKILKERTLSLAARLFLGFLAVCLMLTMGTPDALAGLDDDRYDGNIFPLYAGNGYLVPPKVTLAESLKSRIPTILVFYVDDSSDCKRYAPVISQLDAFYGRAADLIPISIDSIPAKASYEPTEAGYYYEGYVPQTIIFDQSGKVRLNEKGILSYEKMDDLLRELFDLLPRTESTELKRRVVNEFNTELVQ